MRQCRRMKLCAAAAVACCAGVAGIALAHDNLFSKTGTSLPTRVPAVQAPSSVTTEVLVSLADDKDVLAAAETSATAIVMRTGEAAFSDSVPLGDWYDVEPAAVNKNGVQTRLNRRTMRMDQTTYRGQLNILLNRLKVENPNREIYLVTPEADSQAVSTNGVGAVLGDYAAAVREAGNVWAVTVVDLAGDAPATRGLRTAFGADVR